MKNKTSLSEKINVVSKLSSLQSPVVYVDLFFREALLFTQLEMEMVQEFFGEKVNNDVCILSNGGFYLCPTRSNMNYIVTINKIGFHKVFPAALAGIILTLWILDYMAVHNQKSAAVKYYQCLYDYVKTHAQKDDILNALNFVS